MKTLSREFFPGWFAAFCLLPFLLTSCGDGSSSGSSPQSIVTTATTPAPVPGISLLAGKLGGTGNGDGVGQEARFNGPRGVAVDSAGDIFVADSNNGLIRKIAPDGTVTTLDGEFNTPTGMALDSSGNLYVADTQNHVIRKILPDGTVSIWAGHFGVSGDASDANGTNAYFNLPYSIAFDSAGNLFVADVGNAAIRRIAPDGDVTTLAGGTDSTTFKVPVGLAVAADGAVYVADAGDNTVRQVSGGVVSLVAGTPGVAGSSNQPGAVTFNFPRSLVLDGGGNLFVADSGNHVIRKIAANGVVTTPVGEAGTSGLADGNGDAARFNVPSSLALDASGNLLVSDYGNDSIRQVAPDLTVTTVAGAGRVADKTDSVGGDARFNQPAGVGVDSAGNVYVVDAANSSIRKIAPDRTVTTWAGTPGEAGVDDGSGTAARFGIPLGIAVGVADTVYVADTYSHTIRSVSAAGVVRTLAGAAGSPGTVDGTGQTARFNSPRGVAADLLGNVYVADTGNSAIRKVSPSGVVTTLAGSIKGEAGYVDSADRTAARFKLPSGIAVAQDGTVYVADTGNNAIRKIGTDGAVSTVAGSTMGDAGSTDDVGTAARFNSPAYISVDADNNIYVADAGNHTIRKVNADTGLVTTLAGTAGKSGVLIGSLPGRLNAPLGMAIGNEGELYTTSENSVLKLTLDSPASSFGVGINASPTTIYLGQSTTLTWGLRRADTCTASVESDGGDWSGADKATPPYSQAVTPTKAGTYHYAITCTEAGGGHTPASSSVEVLVKNVPPSLDFSATKTVITPGQDTTLHWAASNADSCEASGGEGWAGSRGVTDGGSGFLLSGLSEGTHTYSLTCTGPGGAISRTVNILAANPPTLTLAASSLSVNKGQSLTLSWTGSNVTSCTANGGWSGGKSVTGSESVTPSASGSVAYAMTCSGTGGNVTKVVTVTVGGTGSGGGSNDGGGSGGGGASGLDLLLGLGGLALLRRRLRKHPGVAA